MLDQAYSTKNELLKQINWCSKIEDSSLLLSAINKYGKEQREIGFTAGWIGLAKNAPDLVGHNAYPKCLEDFEREFNGKML